MIAIYKGNVFSNVRKRKAIASPCFLNVGAISRPTRFTHRPLSWIQIVNRIPPACAYDVAGIRKVDAVGNVAYLDAIIVVDDFGESFKLNVVTLSLGVGWQEA